MFGVVLLFHIFQSGLQRLVHITTISMLYSGTFWEGKFGIAGSYKLFNMEMSFHSVDTIIMENIFWRIQLTVLKVVWCMNLSIFLPYCRGQWSLFLNHIQLHITYLVNTWCYRESIQANEFTDKVLKSISNQNLISIMQSQ